MSEEREPFRMIEASGAPQADAMSNRRAGSGRKATWPLLGFLLGFIVQPGSDGAITAFDFTVVSLGVGVVWAILLWIAALIFDRRLGKTKAALPYSQGATVALLFTLSIIVIVTMKLMLLRGGLPLAIGIIPIAIVGSGKARAEKHRNKGHTHGQV